MTFYSFDDFKIGEVEKFGDYLITEQEIIEFAKKYDPHPFHLSHELAKETPFGALCASGWMTCAVTMRMLYDHILVRSSSIGSPGVDQVRWHLPVYVNDRLTVTTEVVEARISQSRPEMGIVKSKISVRNQNSKVVLSYLSTGMFLKK